MSTKYDFSGWASKNDLRCSDGRIIRRDAFKDNDGKTVPLVWQHQHNEPENVLGHALLENRDEGVYAYCTFNDTARAQDAKALVRHQDITSLSIYANQLQQKHGDVIHGTIREVSLVLAGANPGAVIEFPYIEHSDGSFETAEDEAYLSMMLPLDTAEGEITHADEASAEKTETPKETEAPSESKEKTVADVFDTFNENQKKLLYATIDYARGNEPEEADAKEVNESVFNSLNEEQKKVFVYLMQQALDSEEADEEDNTAEHSDEGGEEITMSINHNVFDQNSQQQEDTLSHDALNVILSDGKRFGSLKDSFLAHADEYGITNIDYLFPDERTINNTPEFIKRDTGWVTKVMSAVHHTPFSRIKSVFADITEEDARAKGYIKGNLKKEEVFALLKRTTTPQTVYKKQKLDRDDVIDIVDFDVVAWLKTEMRMMLDEELARAYLFGDGRLASSDDKINESNIRPILTDAALYTIVETITAGATDDETAKAIIRGAIKSRKNYKGSGTPTLFTTEEVLCNMLLLEDTLGHALYKTEGELATKMRVKEIVTVPDEIMPTGYYGLIVNLTDYNVGADKGGAVNMFDDFDIDYNQQKYLIETRCSGALIRPYSAIALKAAE